MLILVVEDDTSVARFIVRGLQEEGWNVDVCARGDEAITQGSRHPYDLILIDWRLPGMDGVAVIREWRSKGLKTPIIMLTARSGMEATVEALDAGADDYVTKPFRFEELLARMRARFRRATTEAPVKIGNAEVDLRQRVVIRDGHIDRLSTREFDLLDLLLKERGKVVTRSRILDQVWGLQHDITTNVIDVYIRYLRARLDGPNVETSASVIETVRGQGYRIKEEA